MKRILTLSLLAFVVFGFSGCGDDYCAEVLNDGQNTIYLKKGSNIESQTCQVAMDTILMSKIRSHSNDKAKNGASFFKIYAEKNENDTLIWLKRGELLLDIDKSAKLGGKKITKRSKIEFEKISNGFATLEQKSTLDEFDKKTKLVFNSMVASSRIDAEIAKAANNIQTAFYDFDAYYNSMGKFDKMENMTNVPKEIKVIKEVCARFNVKNENEIEIITSKEGNCEDVMMIIKEKDLKAEQVGKGKIVIK
ncbi:MULTISPECIES: hypothetical protein [unclassified Campylobacter]|uniref:hypothetical protein n=1 Tax=unclassified Campylobacter TaxID=2593542 RepID=UPI0022E9ADE6|nr:MULTISPECIES: hypothetical protein [unclassified Campylobacter]MDA3043866.1 hypothetical protein [Campylobacter sp. JMF_09 ED2]MDA3044015.1 hypothetical protein [Campylobacter sp. JMF_07 ED4]MDA3064050.1 hypothetical protein [Campylobacter sp. JMF_11 EL3]MDA3072350.1 hypothetical protein [Campylobacter sp. VBCF_03 NA9]MDA3074919.1 hypothetical protein [Campylobacter sp. JMF_05 ED3]